MIRSTLLMVVLVVGCSTTTTPRVHELAPEAVPPIDSNPSFTCDLTAVDVPLSERAMVALLEDVVRSACPSGGNGDDPLCSSLFLIAATDPVVAASAGFAPDLIDRLVPLHVEVLQRGADQARRQSREGLATALELVVDLDVGTAIRSESTLAAFVVDRGAPAVVEPVRLAEAECR